MKTLSSCFLTRNEERTIERAVRSARAVADEVIVADTHSEDRTAEVAAAAGATVVPFTWGDDFAAGRDYTIRQARGDWVLWMHGSEELLPAGRDALRQCMTRDDAFGFFVRIENCAADGAARSAETADLRLFRRRIDLPRLFVGRLHPHFHPDVMDAVRREGLEVGHCDAVLRHYADPSPLGPSKLRFNARLLEAELNDRPGQLHYLIEYGRTLLLMQDPKGHDVLARAAEQVMAARHLPSPPSVKVQVRLDYLLPAPAEKTRAPVPYEDARELAVRWFPSSPNLLWTLAEQAFRRRDYADAASHLERLQHLGRTGGYDRSHRFDPAVLGAESLINLGACYLQMKRLDQAEACFLQLTTHPKLGPAASRMLALAQKWRSQSPPRQEKSF